MLPAAIRRVSVLRAHGFQRGDEVVGMTFGEHSLTTIRVRLGFCITDTTRALWWHPQPR